ncbi:MAG: hypothetical protein HY423_07365 [Candidatus Lambdaproteobacteria bacterium]|nr:hypothetical protein [Candidatus Lambdaproteobacteria bacterium]
MAIKVPIYIIPGAPVVKYRNQYTDSLENMFVEAIRLDPHFGTYQRWESTDYSGPFSELKSGFLSYNA